MPCFEHVVRMHLSPLAVVREFIDLGITHIDTSNAYGPRVTN